MKKYKKPCLVNMQGGLNIVPLASASAAALAAGGATIAFAAGVASGLMKDSKVGIMACKPLDKLQVAN